MIFIVHHKNETKEFYTSEEEQLDIALEDIYSKFPNCYVIVFDRENF